MQNRPLYIRDCGFGSLQGSLIYTCSINFQYLETIRFISLIDSTLKSYQYRREASLRDENDKSRRNWFPHLETKAPRSCLSPLDRQGDFHKSTCMGTQEWVWGKTNFIYFYLFLVSGHSLLYLGLTYLCSDPWFCTEGSLLEVLVESNPDWPHTRSVPYPIFYYNDLQRWNFKAKNSICILSQFGNSLGTMINTGQGTRVCLWSLSFDSYSLPTCG